MSPTLKDPWIDSQRLWQKMTTSSSNRTSKRTNIGGYGRIGLQIHQFPTPIQIDHNCFGMTMLTYFTTLNATKNVFESHHPVATHQFVIDDKYQQQSS